MAIYQVDSQQVALAASNAAATASEIRAAVSLMVTQLRALEGAWVGAAAASFQDVLAGWHATQLQVEVSLDAVSDALGQAAATYSEAEGTAAGLFAGK